MTLRLKLLLLLGALALIPALITASVDSHLLRSLSAEITAQNADAMAAQGLVAMQRVAGEYADVLRRESRRITTLVKLQTAYAERLLQSPRTDQQAAMQSGNDRWSNQTFQTAAGAAADTATARDQLGAMLRFYRDAREADDNIVRWQYIALENGLLATYPAGAVYPDDYDAREREWYQAQKTSQRFRWHRPHVDVSTHSIVMNATMPVFAEDGRFIGVSGIDINLGKTFETLSLPAYLEQGSELLQVVAVPSPPAPEPSVFVLARQHLRQDYADWRAEPELERFTLGRPDLTNEVREAMLNGRDGYVRATVDGEEMFVLYRRFSEPGAYVVMMVPVASATRAAMTAGEYASRTTSEHLETQGLILLTTVVIVVLAAGMTARHLTRPIEELKHAVERLAQGDFATRTALTTGDELQSLGEAFNTMVPQLHEHARVRDALELAREIQQRLLPPAPPQLDGFDICGRSIYSDHTGGDYFDYFPLQVEDCTRTGVVVADVSGHGIGPSLLMATTRALLHGGRGRGFTPGELLGYVNAQLSDDVGSGHFVTLFLLVVDPSSGELEWAMAGHDPALLFRADGVTVEELGGEDIPLGIDDSWQFASHLGARLEPGDMIVIGTDGVWDAVTENGERFGKQRLREYVLEHRERPAADLCSGLIARLTAFRGRAEQNDDVTIVVVRREA